MLKCSDYWMSSGYNGITYNLGCVLPSYRVLRRLMQLHCDSRGIVGFPPKDSVRL